MRIRVRGPSGVSTLTLDDNATVADLLSEIQNKTSLSDFDIKLGYPPKPLDLGANNAASLASLNLRLDGEQLIIGAKSGKPTSDGGINHGGVSSSGTNPASSRPVNQEGFSFSGLKDLPAATPTGQDSKPVSLHRKTVNMEAPELPMPNRQSTLVLRVMPDDNSCLFRAFGHAVIPGDHATMHELRSLVAQIIQAQPEMYTQAILERKPDDYCRWIQTEDAWGGGIEMSILSKHFDIEICSIDVQSLRVDKFNEGAQTRCILVYSGIHYDTIVENSSDPPFTSANGPPELDVRIWDSQDDDILAKALQLGSMLQARHYYTDTGGMAIKCNICGWKGNGEKAASVHAQETGHYDMTET